MIRAKSPQNKNYSKPQRVSLANKKSAQNMYNVLNKLMFKKIRYTFQVLKQFYLFPDGQSSSVLSIQKYDRLIFADQTIHTLVKKLETKIIERKIWAFLNLKMMEVLRKVTKMTQKIDTVVHRKQQQFVNFGYEKIKHVSIRFTPKKELRSEVSLTRIPSQSLIGSGEKTVISITQEFSYRMYPRIYVHRGSRSRSKSSSPNSSFTRVLRQQQIKVYPKEVISNASNVRNVSPKVVVTKITQRTPIRNSYQVEQVKRQYRNCYRVAPTRIRIVSCGCQNLLEKSCKCTRLLDRLCGCFTCAHNCDGCPKCNCCHSHCSCPNESKISHSKEKKSIKFIKSPSKKNIEQKPSENRNFYMNHLQSSSPRASTIRLQHSNTRVFQIKK